MLQETERRVQRLEYLPFGGNGANLSVSILAEPGEVQEQSAAERASELERQIATLREQTARLTRQTEEARREGIEQGRTEELHRQTELLERCATGLTQAAESFRADRDQYLGAVEHEVVRLALAVAARVLHREAQMDPLMLSGAVRVALGQLAETAEVRLRVPAAELDLWAEMLRLIPNLALRPELISDERLQSGEAVLEAQTGSVDLGVRAQMEEIERGFFDLLESREEMRGAASEQASGSRGQAG
ncbi:FliH/SctL family protein [Paracidobacterium acidisoli]|uniref:Flagellar assembly protein FliH n=1 Tax=Paracidobacterium acidisoli TaxID=2303751 RepID=A0A372IR73_9BACT|nr:FliH/SctL family protein [Paracidobacterium acidisoli]MBT9330291.1 hypothetical protein [Paracidobacterium acidisoli]